MDTSQSDLEAFRRTLAELTARIYRIERKLGMAPESASQLPPTRSTEPQPLVPSVKTSTPPSPTPPGPSTTYTPPSTAPFMAEPAINLESRIGSHWLNRIGIAALLIGISYFLKFAFDNNWIGPAGRVTIGLLAGIAVVVWS